MKRRCPATTIVRIEDQQIKEWGRCEQPARHKGPHVYDGVKWRFKAGSYSGLLKEHPEYYDRVTVVVGEAQ